MSAMAALQALRSVSNTVQTAQQHVSSGLRVEKAADNAAYWSISTTMRSDRQAVSAVSDALGYGAAKVDTAYTGMSSVIDILGEFKAKLVAAKEEGVDKAKIQTELDQLKQQVVSIANSTSFSGQNWLVTDVSDITDNDVNAATVVSSFTRDAGGSISVNQTEFHLSETSLFNSTGGGILQPDPRDLRSIGGMRLSYVDEDGILQWSSYNGRSSSPAAIAFDFSGPINFDDAADQITFDVTVDADNPADGLPGAADAGQTRPVTIDRATVDAVNASWNGVISTYTQYIQVLNFALGNAGSDATAMQVRDNLGNIIPNKIAMVTDENRANGHNGSYIQVAGAANTTNSRGGLGDAFNWGVRSSTIGLTFDQFQDYKDGDDDSGVVVSFSFSVNGAPAKSYSFNRTYVNDLFDKDSGKVETADEMVTLLKSLMGADWPDVIIESNSASNVTLRTDPNVDRRAGSDTRISFSNINVSIEPIAKMNFLEIDIARNPKTVNAYLDYIEAVTRRAVDGASALGALQSRIDMQSEFAARMMASIDKGVGRLVDADMEQESAKLTAAQAQQQIAIQSLSIANSAPGNLMQLFRN